MEDDYDHVSDRLFYSSENCPGRGCDPLLFEEQLVGCSCSDGCRSACPCAAAAGDSNGSGGSTGAIGGADDYCGSAIDGGGNDRFSHATGGVVGDEVGRPVRECNSICVCGSDCPSRVVQRGPRRGLSVFGAGERGLGLRTEQAIPPGAFVCCYAGEVIGAVEARRRFALDREHNYILALREHCAGRLHTTFIDATQVCNIGHYANHSCRPNLALCPVRIETPVPHAALFAIREIAAGEELTFSYGTSGEATAGGRRCLCGERECGGWMPSEQVLPDVGFTLEDDAGSASADTR